MMYLKNNSNIELINFYKNQIENNFYKFWNKAVDRHNGGIFNCFNNTGTELISKNKYTWSQGRFVWIWSKLYELAKNGKLSLDTKSLNEDLDMTVTFLEKHIYLPNNNCAFLMDEKGNWLESSHGKGYDNSFYADCFVVLGFSAYARVFNNKHYAELALKTYKQIQKRLKDGNIKSEPYPIPNGYKFHSVPMIMLNVAGELALALKVFDIEKYEEVDADSCNYMNEIVQVFYNVDDGIINEVIGPDDISLKSVLCQHFNPGHVIEDMWFVLNLAQKKNNFNYISKAAKALKTAITIGWDDKYGGLLRFTDKIGGKPNGEQIGYAYEKLILETWDTKLWWPHSEMLYATLLAYSLTRDEEFISLYNMVHHYAFKTFPNENDEIGEWIQIRDRKGRPINKVVALPVKDPYHILRSMILILELLGEKLQN